MAYGQTVVFFAYSRTLIQQACNCVGDVDLTIEVKNCIATSMRATQLAATQLMHTDSYCSQLVNLLTLLNQNNRAEQRSTRI